ncbi:uncharacterized protein SPSK_08112 [Sporothrix schenckii 1099-18]|uniref:Uncharacterized protein n=1 Tax=Sporothrix schenckii 1099-18 TaxID=1397361 RepID=A0A0F2MHT8_SPOSC|nr:uncharacterized protein SPSK_08112 [Sporothrix schenckii 1099-18]KJR87736.1 hypothetical protein SPSK_08112 [Sporothrix schenckii 1099-18]
MQCIPFIFVHSSSTLLLSSLPPPPLLIILPPSGFAFCFPADLSLLVVSSSRRLIVLSSARLPLCVPPSNIQPPPLCRHRIVTTRSFRWMPVKEQSPPVIVVEANWRILLAHNSCINIAVHSSFFGDDGVDGGV